MLCPECDTNNAAGKLLCINCGVRLARENSKQSNNRTSGYAQKYGLSKDTKKQGKNISALIILSVFLLLIIGILYLAAGTPEKTFTTKSGLSYQDMQQIDLKFKNLAFHGKKRKQFADTFDTPELNFFFLNEFDKIKKYFRQGNIKVNAMRINITAGNVSLIFKLDTKIKYIYILLNGNIQQKDDLLKLKVNKVAIGKLNLPLELAPFVARIIKPEGNPLAIELPDYITEIQIKDKNMIISTGSNRH